MCLLILTPFLRRKMNTIKGRVAEPVAFWKTTLCCSEPRQQQNHFSCSLVGLGEKKDCVLSYTISLKSDNVFKGEKKSQLQYEEKGAGGLMGLYPGNVSGFLANHASKREPTGWISVRQQPLLTSRRHPEKCGFQLPHPTSLSPTRF